MTTEGIASGAAALVIEDKAAEWVAESHDPECWTVERQDELNAWLGQSLSHRVAYLRMEATWRRTNRLIALRAPMQAPSSPNNNSRGIHLARVVGSLCLVALTAVLIANYPRGPHGQLIETPKGGQERLALADGSQIELNTDSAIRLNIGSTHRWVELVRGEAFFSVKHDASRPFVVTAAGHTITDLGTKFLVGTASDSLRVSLVEGQARLETAPNDTQQRAVVLSSGDVAIATAEMTKVLKKSSRELTESLAWQHGLIVFHSTPLADAVAEFNRYGGTQLIVTDRAAAKLTINGTFRFTSAENFAASTREIFNIKVTHKNGTIILSR